MFRLLTKLVPAVLASLVFVDVASALHAVPMKSKAVGTITSVVPGTLSFTESGKATHFGNFSVVGSSDFDLLGNLSNGHFTTTTADGATITGTLSGTYAPQPSGKIQLNVTVVWLEGTGRLAGVTGQANIVALLDALAPGAAFSYAGLGHLVLP